MKVLLSVGLVVITASAQAADPVCSLQPALHYGAARPISRIHTIVLHHTAIDSLRGSLATLRERGMSYHYMIDTDGTIIATAPIERIASHAAGANHWSVGIAFVGGSTPQWTATAEQRVAAKRLIGRIARRCPSLRYLVGHGDVRDSNAGEPYNVKLDDLISELHAESLAELHHPTSDELPLASFRRAAEYLQAHPRLPSASVRSSGRARVETLVCGTGNVRHIGSE